MSTIANQGEQMMPLSDRNMINYMSAPGIPRKHLVTPTINRVMDVVCSVCDMTPIRLLQRTKKREIVTARQFIMYICNKRYGRTTVDIGKYFSFDHSTVVHNIQAMGNYLDTDDDVKLKYEQIIKKLNF